MKISGVKWKMKVMNIQIQMKHKVNMNLMMVGVRWMMNGK